MRAIFLLSAAFVGLYVNSANGFLEYGTYREAKNTYYDIITECEKEGGECKDVDFNTPDPPPPTPTPTPAPPAPPPAPLPQAPLSIFPPLFDLWQWPFFFPNPINTPAGTTLPPARPPRPATRPPRPAARPPRPATNAPRQATRTSRPTTKPPRPTFAAGAKKAPPRKPKKKNKKRRKPKRRMRVEQEKEARRRRAAGPGPFEYLYNECSGGWEFDLGCSLKGKNVCCFSSSSSSGSSTK